MHKLFINLNINQENVIMLLFSESITSFTAHSSFVLSTLNYEFLMQIQIPILWICKICRLLLQCFGAWKLKYYWRKARRFIISKFQRKAVRCYSDQTDGKLEYMTLNRSGFINVIIKLSNSHKFVCNWSFD